MQSFNIKAVSHVTGINENTLRAWERRYQLIQPTRSSDGHRLYSKKDVTKLALLWLLVKQGHQISSLARLSMEELTELAEASQEAYTQKTNNQTDQAEVKHLKTILTSLAKFDLEGVDQSLQDAKFELSPRSIVTKLILPLLREVGRLVDSSVLSIAQEHLLSSLLRDYLGNLYQSLTPYSKQTKFDSRRVLLTTREGDPHEFGILLAAILSRAHGHETLYLGPNMPVGHLADACSQLNAGTVVVGLVELPPERELISRAEFLNEFDRLAPKDVSLICGGSTSNDKVSFPSGRSVHHLHSLSELDLFFGKKSKGEVL